MSTPRMSTRSLTEGEDESDDEIETMYVLVELPKGTRTNLSMDQLSDLNGVAPILQLDNTTISGRVEEPLGTQYIYTKKRERSDDSFTSPQQKLNNNESFRL
eukprot:CAMPEP_0197314504 /NCGR_PEP_ID=MMETSP0891-20130614/34273_1 /TAXON_ID=44058 ORGANISM="Aureoumbra lagunensis, Strain CCMP1510" /NCGR_SAMPLE_ID=MMETSP0891 /ASSEMBLY_ACC=CAM_ASM_000534 /LENGTH=101 /DNA_ID=CAMNT_0042802987 /DNA_START=18 /DNA_END=320 /DNA_ORIENTATION=+